LISLLQGLLIGLSIVLPGMSGGTVFLILGIYEKSLQDIAHLYLKPYKLFLIGTIAGIFLGGQLLGRLLVFYRDPTAAFFLGILLASIKTVFKGRPSFTPVRVLTLAAGFFIGFYLAQEPLYIMGGSEVMWPLLIIGGALSCATMLLPGVPGSAVLIVMGIYDDVLFSLKNVLMGELLIFGAGALLGIYLFSRVLEKLYFRYQVSFAFLFAGLIAGSTRALFPAEWGFVEILVFLAGFCLIWFWGGERNTHS